jgi:hypothetical protein
MSCNALNKRCTLPKKSIRNIKKFCFAAAKTKSRLGLLNIDFLGKATTMGDCELRGLRWSYIDLLADTLDPQEQDRGRR